MNYSKIILITVLVLLTSLFYGQNHLSIPPEKPFIEVVGTAKMEIIPDEIYISITISERDEGREKITILIQENRLKKEVR